MTVKIAPCAVCGTPTEWACSDCKMDTGKAVHVCGMNTKCMDEHEATQCSSICVNGRVVGKRVPLES